MAIDPNEENRNLGYLVLVLIFITGFIMGRAF